MRLRPPLRGRRAETGYTLIALAVAAGVCAIIGSLLAAVLVILIRFNSRGASEVETERLARIALDHLTGELREAPAGTGTFAAWPWDDGQGFRAIGFVSARQETGGRPFAADPEGRPQWRTAVYYVHDRQAGTLRRMTSAWNGTLAGPPEAGGRLAARGVRRMNVSRRGELVTVTLDLTAGSRALTLEAAARPRN